MATATHFTDSPRDRIVRLLQRHGPLSVPAFRRELSLSDTAVRLQLKGLLADGYIRPTAMRRNGVGRPQQLYELTEKAGDLFACHCEDLALNLYEELLADQGVDVMQRLLARVGEKLADRYGREVRGQRLHERVYSFAQALEGRGVVSDVSVEADFILLHEYNCPYHELAMGHREICEMEQDMMAQVLDAQVGLSSCMMDGHTGCAFVVRPKAVIQTQATEQSITSL